MTAGNVRHPTCLTDRNRRHLSCAFRPISPVAAIWPATTAMSTTSKTNSGGGNLAGVPYLGAAGQAYSSR